MGNIYPHFGLLPGRFYAKLIRKWFPQLHYQLENRGNRLDDATATGLASGLSYPRYLEALKASLAYLQPGAGAVNHTPGGANEPK
jgi:hypothetical protein